MTPEQQKLYRLYFPVPDMYRFTNQVVDNGTTDLAKKYAWLKKPFGQAVGMSVPVATDKIKENNIFTQGIVEHLETLAHEYGVDDDFSAFNFIDKEQAAAILPDLPELPNQSDINALMVSFREIKENPIGQYIVIALAVITFILILKMLS